VAKSNCQYIAMRLAQVFPEVDAMYDRIRWDAFGATQSAAESVLWLGGAGASTALHYDAFGCNLVAQVRTTAICMLHECIHSSGVERW
jgi:hypothetical protein